MKIQEFREWAEGHGLINPVDKEEELLLSPSLEDEDPANNTDSGKTGNVIHVFVTPVGNIVQVTCDKDGEIIDVSGYSGYEQTM